MDLGVITAIASAVAAVIVAVTGLVATLRHARGPAHRPPPPPPLP